MHVCVFVFDLLYVDGDSLVHLPLRQRRARLATALPNLQPGHVQFATSMEFQPAAVSAAAAADTASADATAAASRTAEDADNSVKAAAAGMHSAVRDGHRKGNDDDGHNRNDGSALVHGGEGGGDIGATTEAATAAVDAVHASSIQANDGSSLYQAAADEGKDVSGGAALATAGAASTEAAVSDLAIQSIEDRIQEFLLESFAGGTEGLMLKALDVAAGYQPSKRSDSWIKLKRCAVVQSIAMHACCCDDQVIRMMLAQHNCHVWCVIFIWLCAFCGS